ncbi:MAG: glyoxylate/hydroxypyruvate reductase A, partial [Gallionellaceae bacterium]
RERIRIMSLPIPFVGCLEVDEKGEWLTALQASMPEYRICDLSDLSLDERARADVVIVANPDITDLAELPNLRWVQSLWSGVEHLVAKLPNSSVQIVKMSDPQLAETMAEAVLAWTLYLHRDMPRYQLQQAARIWRQHDAISAGERTVSVLGLGKLGKAAVVKLLSHGFTVCGWSQSKTEIAGAQTYCGAAGLESVLRRSNIVVILLPLTEQTRGLMNERTMSLMPRDASLINFARGAVVVTNDLLALLDRSHLEHVILDVFDIEPLSNESPLWNNPKVTVLPHISAPTNRISASAIVAKNIRAFLKHGVIPECVDRERGY